MTIDFDPWLSLEIEGTYHSIAKCQQLAHIAAIAATDVSNLFIASKGFTTFTENGRIYDLASFSDSYEEPLPMEAWLVSYMLKNNLYEEVLTSEDSRRVLKEKYDIGFGEPYRPTNYIDSSDEEAYMNVEFDEMSILAIEDKLILLIGVIAHNLGLDHECVRDHFNGDSGKQHYFECNRELFMTIAGK